ncbi:hypothetical protein EMIHUDRAFT_211945 [Emiliania huxleyi CCMP1516]|uniref:DUF6816 domain-containing protein n=2 Tax=Emiliania huxleyi TaxID=2903 RepID=A0A0D3IRZ0_EMIH1|nr:hypothetical protein EMIHUDRAFT_211945 [Emiliania huxleyi CCMP1516]EOD14025.1 hypothetical protein EMIHUDRAFT_211945 [Emiliania huxleyi CCMP1516]|eukprot:XP_005766454.1 hypothetical protein EMIHUDRAFT_211945 [Emiliania huxleyi CCMP1516]
MKDKVRNKLSKRQHEDEASWSTRSWLSLQAQRMSVALQLAAAEEIATELRLAAASEDAAAVSIAAIGKHCNNSAAMVELARRSVLLNLLATPLAPRLAPSARLTLPTASGEVGMAGCVSYPDWLLGTWDVSNTLQRFVMPLGSALVDPLTQLSAMDDLRRDETLRYLLRWTRDGTGACVQDRAFNGAQEAAAFLGDLGSVAASEGGAASRKCPNDRQCLTTPWSAPKWRTPAVHRAHGAAHSASSSTLPPSDAGDFLTSELLEQRVRSSPDAAEEVILAGGRDESISRERRIPGICLTGGGRAAGWRRLAQYGPDGGPSRGLASGRAVSCFDYSWELTRVDEAERVLGGADLRRAGAA